MSSERIAYAPEDQRKILGQTLEQLLRNDLKIPPERLRPQVTEVFRGVHDITRADLLRILDTFSVPNSARENILQLYYGPRGKTLAEQLRWGIRRAGGVESFCAAADVSKSALRAVFLGKKSGEVVQMHLPQLSVWIRMSKLLDLQEDEAIELWRTEYEPYLCSVRNMNALQRQMHMLQQEVALANVGQPQTESASAQVETEDLQAEQANGDCVENPTPDMPNRTFDVRIVRSGKLNAWPVVSRSLARMQAPYFRSLQIAEAWLTVADQLESTINSDTVKTAENAIAAMALAFVQSIDAKAAEQNRTDLEQYIATCITGRLPLASEISRKMVELCGNDEAFIEEVHRKIQENRLEEAAQMLTRRPSSGSKKQRDLLHQTMLAMQKEEGPQTLTPAKDRPARQQLSFATAKKALAPAAPEKQSVKTEEKEFLTLEQEREQLMVVRDARAAMYEHHCVLRACMPLSVPEGDGDLIETANTCFTSICLETPQQFWDMIKAKGPGHIGKFIQAMERIPKRHSNFLPVATINTIQNLGDAYTRYAAAREILFKSWTLFGYKRANHYMKNIGAFRDPSQRDDYYQAALGGVLTAIDRFDVDTFSSGLGAYIGDYIYQALQNCRANLYPGLVVNYDTESTAAELRKVLQDNPHLSTAEAAQIVGIGSRRAEGIQRVKRKVMSMDGPLSGNDGKRDFSLHSILSTSTESSAEREAHAKEIFALLTSALDFSEQEKLYLKLRFGIGAEPQEELLRSVSKMAKAMQLTEYEFEVFQECFLRRIQRVAQELQLEKEYAA